MHVKNYTDTAGHRLILAIRSDLRKPELKGRLTQGHQSTSSVGRQPQADGLPRRVAFAANGRTPALDARPPECRYHVVGG
jgi:hypothetical protein